MRITRPSYGATSNDAGALNKRVFYWREERRRRRADEPGRQVDRVGGGQEFRAEIREARAIPNWDRVKTTPAAKGSPLCE